MTQQKSIQKEFTGSKVELEYSWVNLQFLNLYKNNIIYASPLQNMVKLSSLSLYCNKVQDLFTIMHHLNYDQYTLSNQLQPSNDEQWLADKMDSVHQSTSLLIKMNGKRKNNSIRKLNLNAQNVLEKLKTSNSLFASKIVLLVNALNKRQTDQ
ncbi:Hypothetical_protein [Hexamita inflata]|uniref:Hypothetical_protein n=1 Tax=Hexamita inflata TaxID=28002 RepID=A0AA86UJI9_9EUKA|nr:Hypothetical protein HINF_LOCUS41282 [Hexamita inflata]